jgi:hypothetical protein
MAAVPAGAPMPVTAKLSRRFYEALGDEIANELVDWFNQVDATYHADLRELNEANFTRFDARLEQRFAEFELKVDRRLAEFDRRLVGLEARMDSGFERLRSEMTAFKAELIKWMFLFWLGTVATTLAISQAVK